MSCSRNDGTSKEKLHFDNQSKRVNFLFQSFASNCYFKPSEKRGNVSQTRSNSKHVRKVRNRQYKRRKLSPKDHLLTSSTLNRKISKVTWKDFKSILLPMTLRITKITLLNNKRFYWHQLETTAFDYWKIWHFPTLRTRKHLISWRLCYASMSSRHVWRLQTDTVSILLFSNKGSPSLTSSAN